MLIYLAFIFSFFTIYSAIMVIISKNPVHSVFFLILSFILVCGDIFLLELEFIPLIFIVVYVGAISILFLFVIMMLDIKISLKQENPSFFIVMGLFCGLLFFFCIFFNIKDTLFINIAFNKTFFSWFCFIDKLQNLNSLGQFLYLDFLVHFLVVGLILLIAIIGAVVLTIQLNNSGQIKGQHMFKQVSRTNLETFYLIR